MTARVVVCCGAGGVGKTTISAALAVSLAARGQRVAVLTIDPARRLADSLDIGELGNTARRVPLERLVPGLEGSLDALMLDAKATFDDLVRRFAPSPAAAERILVNRYYQFASERLGGSHEYMAMEKLLQLWQHGPYDVIVLDTPPSRHALDFLDAPDRMVGLMDQGVLRWLVMPATAGGWRALELGSEVVAKVLKRLLGRGTVGEIAEFFEAFRELWDGFRGRSEQVQALLRDPHTRFVLVTTPAPSSRAESLYFLEVMKERGLPFGGFVVNRTVPVPAHVLDPAALPADGPLPPARWAAVLHTLTDATRLRRQLAEDQQVSVMKLRTEGPQGAACWQVPEQQTDLHDLEGLLSLMPWLPADPW